MLTVFITGATAGFGAAIARRYIARGDRVIATGRRQERLDALAAELGERCLTRVLDVRDRDAVQACVASVPWDIDVLVNNAGLGLGLDKAYEGKLDDWDRMIDTNCKGVAYVTRAVLPGMVERKRGHVVMLGSIAGRYAYPGGNVYGATKAFVDQLSMNLRADLLGTPVRITNIEPGLVGGTEFSTVRFAGDQARADKVYEGTQPLLPEDIAEAVVWATTLPAHVNVNGMQLMPVCQAFAPLAIDRKKP